MKKEYVQEIIQAANSIKQSSIDSEMQSCDNDFKMKLFALADIANKTEAPAFKALAELIEQLVDDIGYYEGELHDRKKEISELENQVVDPEGLDYHFNVNIAKIYTDKEYRDIFHRS